MYDDVKKRLLQSDVESAAADAVENTIAAVTSQEYDVQRSQLQREGRKGQVNTFDARGQKRAIDSRRSGSSGDGDLLCMSFQNARGAFSQPWGPSSMFRNTNLELKAENNH